MEFSTGLLVLMAGSFAGNLVFTAVVHWLAASAELARSSSWRMAAAASLFNSGPWLVVVVGIVAYYVHAEPWAAWFFGGLGIAVSFFGLLAVTIVVRQRAATVQRNPK